MSFQADSRSMLNLPDIQRNMTKTFTKPLRKIINNFTKPNTPKGKNFKKVFFVIVEKKLKNNLFV